MINMSNLNYAVGGSCTIDFLRIRELNPLLEYCEKQGIDLRRSSNRWIGKCPLHNEQNGFAFVIHPDQKWQCYGKCARQGDVIDLEVALHGGTIAEAACRLDPAEVSAPEGVLIPVRQGLVLSEDANWRLRNSARLVVPTKDNPFAFPYVLSDDEIRHCHRYTLRFLDDRAFTARIANHRQWKEETLRGLALDGYLGRDDENHFCFNSAAGCKARWRENGERRFKFLFGKSWLWRGELIPQAETIYLCEGETDAISLIDRGIEDDAETVAVGIQGATLNIEPWAFLFTGKDVVIAMDDDEAGWKAAENIERILAPISESTSSLRFDQEVT